MVPKATQDPQNAWSLTGVTKLPPFLRQSTAGGRDTAAARAPSWSARAAARTRAFSTRFPPGGIAPVRARAASRLRLELVVSPGCHSSPRR